MLTLVVALLLTAPEAPARRPVVPQASAGEASGSRSAQPAAPPLTTDAPTQHVRLVEKVDVRPGAPPPPPSTRKLELVRVDEGAETVVCTLPCDQLVVMPNHEFFVTGPETTTSAKFTLKELARNDRIDATVKPGDRGLWALGLVGTLVGSLGVATGATLALVGLARRTEGLTIGGVISLLAGGVLLVLGGPALLNHATIVQASEG